MNKHEGGVSWTYTTRPRVSPPHLVRKVKALIDSILARFSATSKYFTATFSSCKVQGIDFSIHTSDASIT